MERRLAELADDLRVARAETEGQDEVQPLGRLRVNTALAVMDSLAEHLYRLRRRLVATAQLHEGRPHPQWTPSTG